MPYAEQTLETPRTSLQKQRRDVPGVGVGVVGLGSLLGDNSVDKAQSLLTRPAPQEITCWFLKQIEAIKNNWE